jgi:hypothetical protein
VFDEQKVENADHGAQQHHHSKSKHGSWMDSECFCAPSRPDILARSNHTIPSITGRSIRTIDEVLVTIADDPTHQALPTSPTNYDPVFTQILFARRRALSFSLVAITQFAPVDEQSANFLTQKSTQDPGYPQIFRERLPGAT